MKGGVGAVAAFVLLASMVAATVTVETVNAQASPVATTSVQITGNAYSPPDIIVLKGSKVTWTNKDNTVHTVTGSGAGRDSIDDPYGPSSASPLATGDHTFNLVGTVTYTCRVHPSMKGSVTVVEQFDPAKVSVVNVTADDTDKFLPNMVALNLSQKINWVNTGTHLHDITFEDPSIGSLGDLPAGGTVSFNFTKEGTYAYRCTYHAADFKSGMVGHVGIGPNATFPTLVRIDSPQAGAEVRGMVTIEGVTEGALKGPEPDEVQIDFDRQEKWIKATGVDLWSYEWDTTAHSNAHHTIIVRALAAGEELGRTEISVNVVNDEEAPPSSGATGGTDGNGTNGPGGDDEGNGTPGFGLAAALVTFAWLAVRRRR